MLNLGDCPVKLQVESILGCDYDLSLLLFPRYPGPWPPLKADPNPFQWDHSLLTHCRWMRELGHDMPGSRSAKGRLSGYR